MNSYKSLKGIFILGLVCLFITCKDKKQALSSGEYSHGLHLSTREDATFYAWFSADSIADSSHIAMLCVPCFPTANIAFWQPPFDKQPVFGLLQHLGADSFSLKADELVNQSTQAKALKKGMVFSLQKARPDWQHFYYWLPTDTAYIYKEPRLSANKMRVSTKTRLYSDSLQGEWVRLQTDSGAYWLPRNIVY
ncbi:MAG: hypothetical protein RI894_2632 [Bacteroidota bacterium]|jgi:hypothetical protein